MDLKKNGGQVNGLDKLKKSVEENARKIDKYDADVEKLREDKADIVEELSDLT